ncbi:hypothetical protein AGLY_000434, partial [Aphis glycines]
CFSVCFRFSIALPNTRRSVSRPEQVCQAGPVRDQEQDTGVAVFVAPRFHQGLHQTCPVPFSAQPESFNEIISIHIQTTYRLFWTANVSEVNTTHGGGDDCYMTRVDNEDYTLVYKNNNYNNMIQHDKNDLQVFRHKYQIMLLWSGHVTKKTVGSSSNINNETICNTSVSCMTYLTFS